LLFAQVVIDISFLIRKCISKERFYFGKRCEIDRSLARRSFCTCTFIKNYHFDWSPAVGVTCGDEPNPQSIPRRVEIHQIVALFPTLLQRTRERGDVIFAADYGCCVSNEKAGWQSLLYIKRDVSKRDGEMEDL
jgi:hypothetical protein